MVQSRSFTVTGIPHNGRLLGLPWASNWAARCMAASASTVMQEFSAGSVAAMRERQAAVRAVGVVSPLASMALASSKVRV